MPGKKKKLPVRKGDLYDTGTNYKRLPALRKVSWAKRPKRRKP